MNDTPTATSGTLLLTAREIGRLIGGAVDGDPEAVVTGPARIEEGVPGTLCFLSNPKYASYAYTTRASVLLVSRDFVAEKPVVPTLVRVDDVYSAVTRLLEWFQQQHGPEKAAAKIDGRSAVDPDATLGPDVSVGAFAVVEKGARIGAGTRIHAQSFVGEDAVLGTDCVLHPGARVLAGCVLGDRVTVHANAVIGSDGFGFAPQPDGSYRKIPQLGNVVLGNDVEIGAGATVDRAAIGSTRLGDGVKIDNLVMVAHGVSIGEHTVVAAQAGIAGSTHIGRNCLIGGQAGFVGHIRVADGVKVQAQSGVNRSLEIPGSAWYGSPAMPYNDYLRAYAVFRQLPRLSIRMARLEKERPSTHKPDF
jgi:UDP-3-O-[3-hydroxymyristoyl] glucosamine N-acyltransferase